MTGEFVGRERELAELQAAVADAVAGRGRLFLIVGEPGIGKTRLATEVEAVALAAGARVRWARGWEGGGAPAFWPWTVLVRALARDSPTAALADALSGGAAAVVQLAPELRERVRDLPPLSPGSVLDSEHARFPLFEATARFLRRLADVQPLVLVLDDLHAADHPSLLLLRFLVSNLHDARLLLLGTSREVEAQPDDERTRLLAAIGRAGHRLPLAGWGEVEVARFVASACAAAAPAVLVGALHRVTEGNPFFVDEIVRLLMADGGGRLPEQFALRIPGSVRAAIRERLRPLPAPCLRALGAAAVMGRDFDLAVMREASGGGGESLLDALGQAEAAAVVVRQPGAPGRYSFAHALIRETLYEDLAPADRDAWHRRIGAAIERVHAADLAPYLEQLAHHFAHAAAAGDAAKAIAYDVRAARRAAALLAFEAAARHYERALQVQALHVPIDHTAQLELRLGLGETQAAAWDLDAARRTFRTAADEARRLLRPDALARAALGFAGLGFGLPRGVVDAEIVALLEEALRLLGERRDALWSRVAVRLAVELHFSAEAERRDELSRLAVDTARRVGDEATLAYVINACHFAVWSSAEHGERLALADEAVRLAERIGDPDLSLQGRTWRLLDLAEIGDSIGFDREFEVYERLAGQRRLPRYLGFTAGLHGLRALWLGRFDEAVARADAAMALGERVGDKAAFMSVAIQIFIARRAQGRRAELEPAARAWADQQPAIPATRCLLALLYTDLEREADARREYERLAGDDFVALQRRNMLHPLVPCLAEVCAYLGDRRRAPILYRQLLPFAGRVMGLGPNVLFAPASHALGTLAALLQQWDDAVRHFECALEEAARMQGPVWLAAIQYDYARYALERGDAGRAGELAASALERARALGMPRLAACAGALQARCADVARSADRRARQAAIGVGSADAPGTPPPANGKDTGGRVLHFPIRSGAHAAANRAAAAHEGVFRCEGEYWTIGYDGHVMRLRNTSGLRYVAHLLRHPQRDFHALDLTAVERAPDAASPSLAPQQIADLGLALGQRRAGEELLDARARAVYKEQLDGLRNQLNEARRFNDRDRAARLQGEIDFVSRELARAVGLRGYARPGSSHAERARLNVTRAIKSALRRIAENQRELGLYLQTTIKTGLYCSYTPDPRLPVRWAF